MAHLSIPRLSTKNTLIHLRRRLPLAAVALLLASSDSSLAQPRAVRRVDAQHTAVELIVDRQPDPATREVRAALRFELEQGWHVYWVNPGDSGGPPTVLWQPTAGVALGEFEWPRPQTIPLGSMINYGYEVEVALPFVVRFNRAVDAGTPVSIEGQVKWLICRDVCIPGQARLALTLPLGDPDRGRLATWRRVIDDARAKVPPPAPAGWRATATSTNEAFVLTVRADKAARGGRFFSVDANQINESARQDVSSIGNQLVLTLQKADSLRTDPRTLRGVLALDTGEAYVIEAPLNSAKQPAVPPGKR